MKPQKQISQAHPCDTYRYTIGGIPTEQPHTSSRAEQSEQEMINTFLQGRTVSPQVMTAMRDAYRTGQLSDRMAEQLIQAGNRADPGREGRDGKEKDRKIIGAA